MKIENSQSDVSRWSVALDIGGTHVSAAAIDLDAGSVIEGSRASLDVDSRGPAEPILAAWTQAAATAMRAVPDRAGFAGTGLAMPGPFDYERGICWIKDLDKYESLYGLNIRAALKDRLHLPPASPMIFRNDAVCFLLGECAFGAARGRQNVIALTLGTGFGSGFLRGGEAVESGRGVPEGGFFYNQPWKGATAEEHFSGRGLLRRYAEAGDGRAPEGVKDVADRAAAGESLALDVLQNYGSGLAAFLAPWAAALPADVIVIGGNISRAWEWFGPALTQGLNSAAPSAMVVPSSLLEDAALFGAASLPLRYREPAE